MTKQVTNIPDDIKNSLKKSANLSDLADRAAAWLNVRPIGSTPLAGDPVGDYDAVTKRWVENKINTGTVGPTMNGVMNYGVGDFHLRDSRAYIQPYEVVSDGQLLNRADWPELWAYAQMLGPISDADWLADPLKRGKYSLGNGTTTFRVPDRNGAQTGSVRALFARGDGANSSNDGMIMESFLPNITGNINFHGSGPASEPAAGTVVAGAGGAFVSGEGFNIPRYVRGVSLLSSGANSLGSVTLKASNSSPAYGRNNLATDEVLPRNFSGVWVIRASGGFVAANTSWSVINGDETKPGNNTSVSGGYINSEYKIGTTVEGSTTLRMAGTIGTNYAARITITNATKSVSLNYDFTDDGTFVIPGQAKIRTASNDLFIGVDKLYARDIIAAKGKKISVAATEQNEIGVWNQSASSGNYVNQIRGNWYAGHWTLGGVRGDSTNLSRAQINVFSGSGNLSASYLFGVNGTATGGNWVSTSDERIKENIQRIENPLDKMKYIKGVSWTLKTNGNRGHGFIAQDVEAVFPDAITISCDMELMDGTTVKDVKAVDTYGVAAALHHEAILELMKQVEDLRSEIAELKSTK